jgi:hypothetical protein
MAICRHHLKALQAQVQSFRFATGSQQWLAHGNDTRYVRHQDQSVGSGSGRNSLGYADGDNSTDRLTKIRALLML